MQLLTALAILQQSEYDFHYFNDWYQLHKSESEVIQPAKFTSKLKVIQLICHLLPFMSLPLRLKVATLLFNPAELVAKTYLITKAERKLRQLQKAGLQVVAIAGSYGKTSTKQNLQHLLSNSISILVTPESINTPLGISQVILNQLQPTHQVFVVELGEYYPGDIQKLANFVRPNYGILTPLGRQHLERFKSLEAVANTMHELVEYFANHLDYVLISEKYHSYFKEPKLTFYGTESTSQFRISEASLSSAGTEFIITTPQEKSTKIFSPQFGEHQATNALPTIWLAELLKLPIEKIIKRIPTLPYIPHRLEPQFVQNNVIILDNGYNTNPDSVTESLQVLNQLKPARRFLVTLGFVELGNESAEIHRTFGEQLVNKIDYLGLIDSPNAKYIQAGFIAAGGNADRLVFGKNQDEVVSHLSPFMIPHSVILFEGGYRELYT